MTFIIGVTVCSFLLCIHYYAAVKRFENGDHYLLNISHSELRSKVEVYVGRNIRLSYYSVLMMFTLCCVAIVLNLIYGDSKANTQLSIGPLNVPLFMVYFTMSSYVMSFIFTQRLYSAFHVQANLFTSKNQTAFYSKINRLGHWSVAWLCLSQLSLFSIMIWAFCL